MLHPPQSERAVQVDSVEAPAPPEITAALIEPFIVTVEDIEPSTVPEAFLLVQCVSGRRLIKQQSSKWRSINTYA